MLLFPFLWLWSLFRVRDGFKPLRPGIVWLRRTQFYHVHRWRESGDLYLSTMYSSLNGWNRRCLRRYVCISIRKYEEPLKCLENQLRLPRVHVENMEVFSLQDKERFFIINTLQCYFHFWFSTSTQFQNYTMQSVQARSTIFATF